MKKIFLIYSADAWLSSASKELIAVCESKSISVNLLIPEIKRAAKKTYKDQGYDNADQLFNDSINMLMTVHQTQEFTTNYIIEEREINKIF